MYLPLPPPGSEAIAAFARSRGLPYTPRPEVAWYRAWEPFSAIVAPEWYFNAVSAIAAGAAVVLAEPWAAAGDATPLGRTLLAFVSHPGLRHRAAARVGPGTFLTRVSFLGTAPPKEQSTGDPEWDHVAVTYAASPLDAVRALTPSLRKLLLGWGFEGHVELRPGGLVLNLADAQPTPTDYDRVLRWVPTVVEKALKERA